MISGAHTIIYSKDAEADRQFFRDVIGLPNVDAGDDWLIFGLPPSELAFHPADTGGAHELFLICEDIDAFVTAMASRNVNCGTIEEHSWGRLSALSLPGGGSIGVYEPNHARPAIPG